MENTKHGFSKKADKQLPHERQEAEIKKFRATAMISEKELSELEENGKNPNWEPGVRQEIVATEPDKIERLQEQPKKDLPSSGPKQSFPFRKELPDEFGSDPCLSFADSRQPLLPKDGRTGKQYFLQPSLLRQLREPPRSDLGRSGSKEAIALESIRGKSLRSSSIYGTVYSPLYQRLTELRRMSFSEVLERITLTWDQISVSVPNKQKRTFCKRKSSTNGVRFDVESQIPVPTEEPQYRQILHNVSGIARPGTLLAILGASGSGKTTLLNVLTYRNRGDLIVEGEVRVNGGKIGSAMPSVSAYVQQEDLLLPTITVREHLWFQSQLRMDKEIPKEIREDRVEEVLKEMGLQKCADSFIGAIGNKKSISGGEKKRLVFAAELLTNPPLMFLDEPTSGLDSYMAQNVLMTLKSMARKGRSIICTIHQPSSELFELFDQLMLLSEGRVAYIGPANEASEFFQSCGYPMPLNYNPADHFVRVLAIEPGMEEESKKKVEKICDNFLMTKHAKQLRENIEETNFHMEGTVFDEESFAGQSPYKASWFKQFYVVLWRCFTNNLREPSVFWTRLIQITVISLIFSLVYMQQEMNQLGVANINGALFLMELQMTVGFIFNVIMVFPPEFPLFLKEHYDGMYRADVYFICKTVVEMPQFTILPLIFTMVMYWTVGFYNTATAFFTCFACNFMVCNVSVSFGYLLSTALNNTKTALAIGPLFLAPFIMIGGYFVNTESIPAYFIWLKYISWFTYSNEILIVNQWSQIDKIECSEEDVKCFVNGTEIIESFNYNENNLVTDFIMLLILAMLFRLLALVCFLIRARKSYKLNKKSKTR